MQHRRISYISAFVIIFLIAMFRLLLLALSYYSLQEHNTISTKQLPLSEVINFLSIFPPVVLLAEAFTYLLLRKRYFLRPLVRSHIWMTIVSSFLFPVVEMIFYFVVLSPDSKSPTELADASKEYSSPILIAGWLLFAIARLFFILSLVKSVRAIPQKTSHANSTDLLSDFSDE